MSKQTIKSLLSSLLEQMQSLPPETNGQMVIVGLSGGIDSVVLLHAITHYRLFELNQIRAVHINHGIHPDADQWAQFCAHYTDKLGITFNAYKVELLNLTDNLEQNARNARYNCFAKIMNKNNLLITAHQQSDQAETLLFNLFRGSGVVGLKAMQTIKKRFNGFHFRPLLATSTAQISAYAKMHNLTWIEDPSNQDIRFDRNYIRQQLLPVIKQRWPQAIRSIQTSASHLAQAQNLLDQLARDDLKTIQVTQYPSIIKNLYLSVLAIKNLSSYSVHRQSNLLRYWIKQHDPLGIPKKRFSQLIKQLPGLSNNTALLIEWGGLQLRSYQGYLYLMRKMPAMPLNLLNNSRSEHQNDFPDLGVRIQFQQQIRDRSQFEFKLRVGGEKLVYNGKTRTVKQLLQQSRTPVWERQRLPLIYLHNELIAIAGLLFCDQVNVKLDKSSPIFEIKRLNSKI